MSNQLYVTVELIKNPSVKRRMTAVSAKSNSRKWRIVSDAIAEEPVKKKGVGNAVDPVHTAHDDMASKKADRVVDSDDTGFAKIGEETDFDEQSGLRKEYEELAGKAPDKRWKADRLAKEIESLKTKPAEDEAN